MDILLALTLALSPCLASWQWPLGPPVRVLRAFAPPPAPWAPGHRGVDLAARAGQPVYAAGSGQVGYAAILAGRGVIAITHGALRTTYLPVIPSVQAGQPVRAGQRIGVVEPSPGHCAPLICLHWGLLRTGEYLDPLLLLCHPTIRLLPVWPRPQATPALFRPAPAVPPWPLTTPTRADRTLPLAIPAPDMPGALSTPEPGCRRPPCAAATSPASPLSPVPTPSAHPSSSPRAPARRPSPSPALALAGASEATGGAIAGVLLALISALAWGQFRNRRPRRLPPSVIDLTAERTRRRPASHRPTDHSPA